MGLGPGLVWAWAQGQYGLWDLGAVHQQFMHFSKCNTKYDAFSYVIIYILRLRHNSFFFLGKYSFHRQFLKACLTQKQYLCNMVIFFKTSLKTYLPQQSNSNLPQPGTAFNQSSYQFHHQVPWNLETQVSSLLIIRPTTKLCYQICLHKSERIPSKIKPKALKPSLTSPRQVPLPKREPNKHTRNSQDYNTTKAFNFPFANNVHLPIYYKACHYQSMVKLTIVKHLSKKAHINLQAKPHNKCFE